jgi:hypothetical protein
MSRGALLEMQPALFSDRCPFFLSASMTIGLCCWKVGVFMADHEWFRPVMPTEPMPSILPNSATPYDADLCLRTMVAAGSDYGTVRTRWSGCLHDWGNGTI